MLIANLTKLANLLVAFSQFKSNVSNIGSHLHNKKMMKWWIAKRNEQHITEGCIISLLNKFYFSATDNFCQHFMVSFW